MTDVMESTGPTRRTSGEGLDVTDLRIERARAGVAQTIVSGVSLAVAKGESIGIVGESGSGKSMTARAVTGLLPAGLTATGSISYGNRNLLDLSEREWRQVRGTEIGLILQDPFTMLNPVLRCSSIIGESLRTERRLGRHERAYRGDPSPGRGRHPRPSVATATRSSCPAGCGSESRSRLPLPGIPRLLIADEPSTALDVTTQRDILALIKSIQAARGMGLVLITHDLRVAFAMCDRIYVLYAGTVVEVGDAPSLDRSRCTRTRRDCCRRSLPSTTAWPRCSRYPERFRAPDEGRSRCVFAARCQWATDACRRGPTVTVRSRPRAASRHASACPTSVPTWPRSDVKRNGQPAPARRCTEPHHSSASNGSPRSSSGPARPRTARWTR